MLRALPAAKAAGPSIVLGDALPRRATYRELQAVSLHPTERRGMSRESQQLFLVAPARYVLLPVATLITGYSVKAIERKIERGDWLENKVWRRAPDGRVVFDVVGYQKWVEGQQELRSER